MMMGQGSNNFGGSSNLSALAPPFTVTVHKPLVDLTEPTASYFTTRNWASNSRPDYDSNAYNMFSSNSDPRVSISTDAVLSGQKSASVLEAKPYYPSYAMGNDCSLGVSSYSGYDLLSTSGVATSIGSTHEDYGQSLSGQWSGMWDCLTECQQSEPMQLHEIFGPKESSMNQGFYASDSRSKYEEASIRIDKVAESAGKGKLDYNSFPGKNSKLVPTDYPTPTSMASTLPFPETCPQVSSIKTVNSWNQKWPYQFQKPSVTSHERLVHEKLLTRDDASSRAIGTVMNSSPAVVIKPPVYGTNSFINKNSRSDGDIKDFSGNNPSVMVEPRPFVTSKGNVFYDPSQVSFHLGKADRVTADFSSAINEVFSSNQSVPMDTFDHFAGTQGSSKEGVCFTHKVPNTSLDGLSLVDKTEAIDPVKDYNECLDHHNPAVDSPCWKGAPFSNFSQLEDSESVSPRNRKKLEACRSLDRQGYQTFTVSCNDAVKISPEKTNEKPMQHGGWVLENHLSPSMTRPLVGHMFHREEIGPNANGADHRKSSPFHQVQSADDTLYNKSFDTSDSKLPDNEQQSCEGCKWTTESNCAPVIGAADFNMNMKDDPDDCSYHVPFQAIENVLYSPPSADSASGMPNKVHGRDATQKTYVKTLIDTMQNLSELLVFHFSNDICELKEEDSEALKDVIGNIESCMLKKVEKMNSPYDSKVPERAISQPSEKSSKLQKGTNENGFMISKTDPFNFQASFKSQHVDEEDNVASGNNDQKLPNYVYVGSDANIMKVDNPAQAIKKALAENFHDEEETEPQVLLYKNLWLEAEASLFYASCMARFNRMKSGMEKCDSPITTETSEDEDKPSRSKFSSEPCTSFEMASNANHIHLPDISIPESSSMLIKSGYDDDVAARFHILKCRVNSSDAVKTSLADKILGSAGKMCSSQVSLGPDNVEWVAREKKDGQKPDICSQDSPVLSSTNHVDDIEASVMARFRILKDRGDNSTSLNRQEPGTESADLEYAGLRGCWATGTDRSEDGILDLNMEPLSRHHDRNPTEEELTVEKSRFTVKDCPSRIIDKPGDQSQTGFGDGSSDWEHVLLEELGCPNS
ncbi:uncharacterized protein LOC126686325 [Mercurialis annua]|uniref:uncharacterized protein LOC126686325 n=1 Tax=Mercurialis annua TaxID=3986 RepID=UPI00215EBA0F|nr:uncharacterized protein LOC126686325 [Mercurialis annua]